MASEGSIGRDDALVATARAGDLAAFNQLVDRHERLVYAVCLRLLGDRQLAEDAAQDTFIRAFGALPDFSGGSFRAWLARIATNRCYDLLRASRRHPLDSLDALPVEPVARWSVEPAPPDPAQHAARAELSHRLSTALDRLAEDQRLAVLLSDVHGYSYDEIAEATGAAVGTVKSRLSRGRARLREILRADPTARELFEAFGRHSHDGDGRERP